MNTERLTRAFPKELQRHFFGSDITNIVPSLSNFKCRINEFFLTIHPITFNFEEINTELQSIEKDLYKTLNQSENITGFLTDYLSRIENIKPTPFLSDKVIENILLQHPPKSLNSYLSSMPNIYELSPRIKLSLTRFTEDRIWQHRYQALLSQTTVLDYQYRRPECFEVDANDYRILASQNGHQLKPWGVSHCKETGVIILFENHSPSIKTPILLKLSVFLHYVFEVKNFSTFLMNNDHLESGQLVKNIIRSKEPLLPFLTDGNAHDETLYWRQALTELRKYIQIPDIFYSLGVAVSNNNLYSMHFVDALWNINKINGHNHHKYHLQQEFWLALLQHLSNMTDDKFQIVIEDALLCDNMSFLSNVLKNI